MGTSALPGLRGAPSRPAVLLPFSFDRTPEQGQNPCVGRREGCCVARATLRAGIGTPGRAEGKGESGKGGLVGPSFSFSGRVGRAGFARPHEPLGGRCASGQVP